MSDFKFPIYDTLGKVSYNLLRKNKYIDSKTLTDNNYFELMIGLKKSINVNYEKLDNLLWLLGKIKKGSFSILMDKSKYETIVKPVNFSKTETKRGKQPTSQEKDNEIRNEIKKTYKTSKLFSKDENEFLEFAFGLK